MDSKTVFNKKIVLQLTKILNDNNLSEIEYEIKDSRIRVARKLTNNILEKTNFDNIHNKKTNKLSINNDNNKILSTIKSPMVGTVYHSSNPESPPFIKLGDVIKKGQTLLIIEAMKVMNPLRSTEKGVVKNILVKNAEPVEYNQPLIIFEKN